MTDSGFKVRRINWIGNIFLVMENGQFTMIDTGAWNTVANARFMAKRLGFDLAQLKRIVITHSHFDHAGMLAALKEATGAPVFAHEDEAPYVTKELVMPTPSGWGGFLFELGEPVFSGRKTTVDVTLRDGDLVENTGLRVIHTPGHTPGHICLYHETEKALFTGDILVNHFGMLTGPVPFFSSDIRQARKSLAKLLDLDLRTIYFSHGPPARNPPVDKLRKLYESLAS